MTTTNINIVLVGQPHEIDPTWTVDASHEIIEMQVDPNGNRMRTACSGVRYSIMGNGTRSPRSASPLTEPSVVRPLQSASDDPRQ